MIIPDYPAWTLVNVFPDWYTIYKGKRYRLSDWNSKLYLLSINIDELKRVDAREEIVYGAANLDEFDYIKANLEEFLMMDLL